MQITINTIKKTFTIDEEVNMEEFYNEVQKMFPEGEWKRYKILVKKPETIYIPQPYPLDLSPTLPVWPQAPWPQAPWPQPYYGPITLPYTGDPFPGQHPTITCGEIQKDNTYTKAGNMVYNFN